MPTNECRILIIDNDKDILEVLMIFFKMEYFVVYGLYDEKQIYKVAGEFRPDVVLLDVRLAENDGRDVCAELQKLHNFPIVLFSADTRATDYKDCKAAAFVGKPFNLDDLLQTIKEVTAELRCSVSS